MDAETDGGVSESDYKVGSIGPSHNPGESMLVLLTAQPDLFDYLAIINQIK